MDRLSVLWLCLYIAFIVVILLDLIYKYGFEPIIVTFVIGIISGIILKIVKDFHV